MWQPDSAVLASKHWGQRQEGLETANLANLEKEKQRGPHPLLAIKNCRIIEIEQHDVSTHKEGSGTAQGFTACCMSMTTCVWIPRSHIKELTVAAWPCDPRAGRVGRQRGPWCSLANGIGKLARFRFSERKCLKKYGGG